jgi:hypothetical protein
MLNAIAYLLFNEFFLHDCSAKEQARWVEIVKERVKAVVGEEVQLWGLHRAFGEGEITLDGRNAVEETGVYNGTKFGLAVVVVNSDCSDGAEWVGTGALLNESRKCLANRGIPVVHVATPIRDEL